MTTAQLLDFATFVICLAEDTGLPLSEALHEAAALYPELAAVPADAPACEILPFDPRYWG